MHVYKIFPLFQIISPKFYINTLFFILFIYILCLFVKLPYLCIVIQTTYKTNNSMKLNPHRCESICKSINSSLQNRIVSVGSHSLEFQVFFNPSQSYFFISVWLINPLGVYVSCDTYSDFSNFLDDYEDSLSDKFDKNKIHILKTLKSFFS